MPLTPIAIKTYRANLFQTGTNNPTATIQQNTLGGTPSLTRAGVGFYLLTLEGAFPFAKTTQIIAAVESDTTKEIYSNEDNDSLTIISKLSGTPTDGQLYNTYVEINVYQ